MSSYFKRSRTGCVTCRHLRIKCDEARPSCRRCTERKVICEGYSARLQWVDVTPSVDDPKKRILGQRTMTLSSSSHHREGSSRKISLNDRLKPHLMDPPSYLNPSGIIFPDALDRTLYDHSLFALPNLVFLNRSRSSEMNAAHIWSLHVAGPELRAALLMPSATHLFIQGMVSEIEFLKFRQRAIKAVRSSIAASLPRDSGHSFTSGNTISTNGRSDLQVAFHGSDVAISASLKLAAAALVRGEPLSNMLPIIHGTVFLVMERHKLLKKACGENPTDHFDSPVSAITIRMLAYFDIMSCIPCARAPYLAESYWLTDKACEKQENIDGSGLDPALGCFPRLFALLGRCAALAEYRFFNNTYSEEQEVLERSLLHSLESWVPLPRKSAISASPALQHLQGIYDDYTICISAGHAHSLASRIFLIRSRDFDRASQRVHLPVQLLRSEIQKVPIQSAPMTTMLWPLWVLGCESYTSEMQNMMVLPIFGQLLQRNSFFNIQRTREMLQDRIWKLNGEVEPTSSGEDETPSRRKGWRQSEWVKYCWTERIELILA